MNTAYVWRGLTKDSVKINELEEKRMNLSHITESLPVEKSCCNERWGKILCGTGCGELENGKAIKKTKSKVNKHTSLKVYKRKRPILY